MPIPTVQLSFRYEKSDVEQAMRSHYASLLRPRLDAAIALGLAALGTFLLRSAGSHWEGFLLIGISVAFGLILFGAFVVVPLLIFRRQPKYRDDYSLSFSPEGIHFQTVHVDSSLMWSLYSRALIDSHSYILYAGSYTFTIVPKRVFRNAEEQEAFELLLSDHIPKIVRKK